MTEPENSLGWPQIRDIVNQSLNDAKMAQELQREADDQRIRDLEKRVINMIEANKELVVQFGKQQENALQTANAERNKSAEVLRNETQRALDKADAEREKSASALRQEQQRALNKADMEREKSAEVLRAQLTQNIESSYQNLLLHIEANRDQTANSFAASEKAIEKADYANEKRVEIERVQTVRMAEQIKDTVSVGVFTRFDEENNRRLTELERAGASLRGITAAGVVVIPILVLVISFAVNAYFAV